MLMALREGSLNIPAIMTEKRACHEQRLIYTENSL